MTGDTDDTIIKRINFDIIDRFHSLLEINPRFSKNCFNAIGVLGIFLMVRPYRITQTFRHIHDIPEHFIRRRIRLLGRVASIEQSGIINITHVPVLNIKPPFMKQKPTVPLPVQLACLEVGPAGQKWLEDNLQGRQVWFSLLYRHTDKPALYCSIQIPKVVRNTKVNEELIKLGLCKISYPNEHWQFPEDKKILKYIDRLVFLENHASLKGTGMWEETQSKSNRKWVRLGYSAMKSVITSPFKLLYCVYKKFR